MVLKEDAVKLLETMPKEFHIDDFFTKLEIIEKAKEGLKDIEEGRFISDEDLDKEIDKWFE